MIQLDQTKVMVKRVNSKITLLQQNLTSWMNILHLALLITRRRNNDLERRESQYLGTARDVDNVKQKQRRRFVQLKQDGNDTEQLYLIDAQWVKRWLDNIGGLLLGEDVFFISWKLWNALYDWYGGGPTLKWKIEVAESQKKSHVNSPGYFKQETIAENMHSESSDGKRDSEDSIDKKFDSYNYYSKLREANPKQIDKVLNTISHSPIQSEKVSIRKASSSHGLKKQGEYKLRLFGLENNNLHCYLNSVLQCIFTLSHIREFYLKRTYQMVMVKSPVLNSLDWSRLMEDISSDIERMSKKLSFQVVKTRPIRRLIEKEFNPILEHDSHEFLLYFLNRLKDELTEKDAQHPVFNKGTSIQMIWKQYQQQFSSIIDSLFTVEGIQSIQKSLSQYQQPERLPDYQCETCKMRSVCQIERLIVKLPEIFIFQLQRFSMYPKLRKIRGLIKYGELLDMRPFIQDKYASELCNKNTQYELSSIAVHMGTIHGGHYVAYAKKEDGNWYYMNDERVSRVQLHEVLNQDAYILFYKKEAMSNILLSQTPDFSLDKNSDEQFSICDQNQQPQDLLEIINFQQPASNKQKSKLSGGNFMTAGFDSDYDANSNEFFIEDSLEHEKRTRQREFAKKLELYYNNQTPDGLDLGLFDGMNDNSNVIILDDQINDSDEQKYLNELNSNLNIIPDDVQMFNQSINFDVNSCQDENIDPQGYLNSIHCFDQMQNLKVNPLFEMANLSFIKSDSMFEQMQPQQLDHETGIKGSDLDDFYNFNMNENDSEEQSVIDKLKDQSIRSRKKRGAPFKGKVSDQKEEGFKVLRQKTFREYKQFFEKRSYLKKHPNQKMKKKKVFVNNDDLQQQQKILSEFDAQLLFQKDLFPLNSRHYNKIAGNFDLIREPMYKYRKDVKERLFKDNSMAFLWMYYRCEGEFEVPENREVFESQRLIYEDFDNLALETLKKGNAQLLSYIYQLIRTFGEVQKNDLGQIYSILSTKDKLDFSLKIKLDSEQVQISNDEEETPGNPDQDKTETSSSTTETSQFEA
ncbi:ubiquitin carboxyl-terminal hydrolase family protein [Stylonychia lemnae]|uniref:Ubiquitin carboxyl-terminal hydrolase family protein n=1 Tax=Stylonychia lemnae TaxID=5949 RepID=A0A078AAB4_STYLE|nr:ubiquitin carboxyl-terminal hydrolase family protein [Stylonychia lemnae]|eukprot:CDW78527.1 ubiquitin carboxyl-terminal hydrolase family protein [Stylonychia lemnae]